MIEISKANGLSPFAYLNFILTNHLGKNPSDEDLARLAPWSELAQKLCKSQTETSK